MVSEVFKQRVLNELLPAFCDDPKRGYDVAGFQEKSFAPIQDIDADWFIKGLDANLVQIDGNMYRARRSGAREQLFTEGWKTKSPRRITLWAESVIIIATLSRLHLVYLWPPIFWGHNLKMARSMLWHLRRRIMQMSS